MFRPDYLDDPNTNESDKIITPAFTDIKRKTLRTLYGIDDKDPSVVKHELLIDKSPKGSLDDGVKPLVDLLNAHPSYSTLSSCSGRITLFNPNHVAETDVAGRDIEGDVGKGYGAWLLSSHAKVTTEDVERILNDHHSKKKTEKTLLFKFEPLLLHVAASNLSRARQLLTLALNLGFRESGTVITTKRITVAIRGYSLALSTPLSSGGPLRPSREYITELVREANERFELNEEKLNNFERQVQHLFFKHERMDTSSCDDDESRRNLETYTTCLPAQLPTLNLWRHAAIAFEKDKSRKGDVSLIVFGGFGSGPENGTPTSKRSNKVYCLQRYDGVWDSNWKDITHTNNLKEEEEETFIIGCGVQKTIFPAREGHSACRLMSTEDPSPKSTALVFGGRGSPKQPSNELLLLSLSSNQANFFIPKDVRGAIPSPRWGHTLNALSGRHGTLCVVIGGRNECNIISTVHILSKVQSGHLLWEELHENIPRFDHCSIRLPSIEGKCEDELLVFGGLDSLDVVSAIANLNDQENTILLSFDSDGNKCMKQSQVSSSSRLLTFGASSICFLNKESSWGEHHVIVSGGLWKCSDNRACKSMEHVCLSRRNGFRHSQIEFCSSTAKEKINFGSMINHVSLEIPCDRSKTGVVLEIVTLGGGVPSFSFGQSFAR
jgi:tRNA wybutosine-synthesizing protein 3